MNLRFRLASIARIKIIWFAVVCCSCTKEKIVEKEVEKEVIVCNEPVHKWKKVEAFDGFDYALVKNASRVGNCFVLFASQSVFTVYDSVKDKFSRFAGAFGESQPEPLITANYFVRGSSSGLEINPIQDLPMLNYGGMFSKFVFPEIYDSLYYDYIPSVIGNNNLILFKYSRKKETVGGMYFAARLELKDFGSGLQVLLDSVRLIRNTLNFGSNRVIDAVGQNLLFSMGNGRNYILTQLLDTFYTNRLGTFGRVFRHHSGNYAFFNSSGIVHLLMTTDDGKMWTDLASNLPYELMSLSYVSVGDKVIGSSYGGQLWELTFNGSGVTLKELNNDGLDAKGIVKVVYCNNHVFVCTQSGVYERGMDVVFEYK
jgi:hypothetical protein